jgi:tungstate transport system ATP-binding protein
VSEILLRGEGLAVRAGGRTILDLPGIAVHRGETLVVLGPTGAGKSTLLRVLNLLQRPDAGRLYWLEEEIRHPAPLALQRRMVMAFQNPLLFSGTVFDNVAYGLRLRGVRGRALQERVHAALRRLAIDHLAGQPARKLSGGEAQRTSLARALAIEPELLLLDEPFAALDVVTKNELVEELRSVLAENGATCVYVTHDQQVAFHLADRILLLDRGRPVQCGRPGELYYRPATPFAALFVGMENMVEGTIVEANNGLAVVGIGEKRLEVVSPLPAGRAVHLCLRPEDITLRSAAEAGPPDSARNHLTAVIRELRSQGPTFRVHLDCGFPLVARITRRSVEELGLSPGGLVQATFKATAAHLIPRAPDPPAPGNADCGD